MQGLVIRTKISALKKRQDELAQRHQEISKELSDLNISRAQLKKAKAGLFEMPIPQGLVQKRSELPLEQKEIEKRISEIKREIRDLHRQQDAADLMGFKKILNEIFTKEQLTEIFDEVRRRDSGEHPCKIRFNFDRGIEAIMELDEYKKLYIGELEKMQEIRLTLTRIIESGCEQFGATEFMKTISPLNKMVIPVNEINKKKLALSKVNHLLKRQHDHPPH